MPITRLLTPDGTADRQCLVPRRLTLVRMNAAYLYFNSVLYAIFAIWCSVSPLATAQGLGYLALNSGGQSEYLVIYGGLQAGLATIFAFFARHIDLRIIGVQFAIALYLPIVLFRLVTIVIYGPVGPLTLATAGLEAFLLVGALGLNWAQR